MPNDLRRKREKDTPAYALTGGARRAIDLIYQKAESLRNALPSGVPLQIKSVVPFRNRFVSGLNVPSNYKICVGRRAINKHHNLKKKALRKLEGRNNATEIRII